MNKGKGVIYRGDFNKLLGLPDDAVVYNFEYDNDSGKIIVEYYTKSQQNTIPLDIGEVRATRLNSDQRSWRI